jgi:uncharacterized membrane protein
MKIIRFFLIPLIILFSMGMTLIHPPRVQADSDNQILNYVGIQKPEYYRGKVIEIISEQRFQIEDQNYYAQMLKVRRQDNGEEVQVQAGSEFQPLNDRQRIKVGTEVILGYQEVMPGEKQYVLADIYRLPVLVWLGIGFLILVIVIARKQGFFSIVGMALSLFVLTYQIVPQILAGQNPIFVSLIGCSIVATLTVYLCHGVSRQSHIALVSMFITLFAVSILSYISVRLAHLVGLGTEEAYYLQFGPSAQLNLQGLLLGGIMLGTLGVLDDITVAQVSVVSQLKAAKPHIDFGELYNRSLAVGKDHVASLVNTLVLAYAGSSLPLFLLFTLSQTQPAWVAINSEMIAEEIVRTLIGSIGLVMAVPLTTIAASYFAINFPQAKTAHHKDEHAGHHH